MKSYLTFNFYKDKALVFYLISLLLVIVPFLMLSFFCFPALDDYGSSARAVSMGSFEFQKLFYDTAGGRYFSQALISINPLVFKWMFGYKLIPVLLFILTFLSFFLFVKTLTENKFSLFKVVIASLTITALYIQNMPDVTMGFYWMTGSIMYQLGNILALFFISAALYFTKMPNSFYKYALALIIFFLIAAVIGSNETILSILLIALIVITVINFKRNTRHKWFWFGCVAVGFICAYWAIAAPGNFIRATHYPDRHNFSRSVIYSFAQLIRFFNKWVFNVPFILVTLLFIPLANVLSDKIDIFKRNFYIHPLLVFMLLTLTIFINFFIVYWSTGLLGQHKTVDASYFLFLIIWFLFISILIAHLKKNEIVIDKFPSYFSVVAVPLISISLLTTGNTKTAYLDLLTGRAYRYNKEMNERFASIQKSLREHSTFCRVKPLKNIPKTIYFIDITENPDVWPNAVYREYFNGVSIATKHE
jgi:hypothetical protein